MREIENLRLRVAAQRGRFDELSRLSGMSTSWLSKFGRGRFRSPRYSTVAAVHAALEHLEDAA